MSLSTFSRAAAALLASVATAAMVTACSPGPNGAAGAQSPTGGALQPTSVAGTGMTVFTDPTENAFTISVPQGWKAQGGVQRSASGVKPWLMVTSSDGATTIRFGDPSIPLFTLPGPMNGNGTPYENSIQFATDYAQRAYAATCAGLTPAGSQAEPALAQQAQSAAAQTSAQMGAQALPVNYDGGSETFTCQANGVAAAVGVIDVTSLYQVQTGGSWAVPTLIAYQTPAASQAQTDQIARAIKASYQVNPQWQAQQLAAARQQYASSQQQGAAAQAALTQQEGAEGQALNAQAQSENAALNAAHAQTMNGLDAQGQRINQNFANQQYNRQTGQDAEMRYINNQVCIRWYDAARTQCAATAQQ